MRKIFSLFAAMFAVLALNAAVVSIAPDSPQASDNIRREIRDHIQPGDTLLLADGVYTEADVVELNKDVVIMAAEGAHPIVKQQYYMKLLNSAKVTIIGVKFDGSLYPATDHCIRAYDATEGKTLTVVDCEFTNFTNGFIFYPQKAERCMQKLTIQNSLFSNYGRSAVYIETGSNSPLPLAELTIENSTFMATTPGANRAIDLKNAGTEVADAKLRIDHCTFYNCNAVRSEKSTDVIVSNSIFAAPEGATYAATTFYAGAAINNCLSYNVALDEASTKTACITGNPLFTDAANLNLTLGEGSPALTAGTDGKAIGDPRWVPAAPIGAPAYFLVGNMNNWKPDSAYMFAVNPANENEYMLNTTLAVGDSVKVLGIVGNTQTWYPDNAPNYGVDAAHAGKKTIYFQTTYKTDWAEFGGYIWIDANPQPKLTIDFATNAFELPTSKTVETNAYTYDGVTLTLTGTSGNGYAYYSKDKYLLNGKQGATIQFSAFAWKTTKIVVTGRSGASGSTKMNIFVGDNAVSTETTGSKEVNTYEIAEAYQAPGNVYVLKVTSDHNAQITKIEIYGEDAPEPQPGCDWDKLDFIGSTDAQYANQFKVCKAGEQPTIVNIQQPGFAREIGIYMTFPSDVFDYTSFDTTKCDIQGAGIIFHLSAFTAKVTDLAVVCGNTPILFSVYNDKGIAPAEPKFYVTGDSALVTDAGAPGKAWAADAVPSMADTLTLNLKANQYYIMKLVDGANWLGYNELSEKTPGLIDDDPAYHNIGFTLVEAGEVKVVYNDSTFKLIGNFYVEPMDTIPTTAPAAPTVAENNVMAIYCNHYTTNNANFAISGWAGAYQTLTIDSTKIAFWKDMTWECVIDPVNTDAAHDFSEYKKLHVDIWAPKAAQIKLTVEAVAGGNYKDGKVVSLAKGWNSFDFDLAEWPGKYDFKNVKCFVLEQYSIEHTPFAIANIYFYDKPQWAAIKFTEVVPKDSLAADASFILLGSDFKAQITDTDNKMEIDANACRFGSAEGYDMFTHRLKTGGKSSATKSFITLTIPEDGKLAIAVRTGSNSATDRNLVIKQGNDTLFNQLILESQAIKIMEDTVEVSVYPYVSIPVEAGNVVLSYPVGSLNFYAFAFKPEPIPVYYMKNNWNEGQWLWREMTRNGMSYKLDSVVYGGNGVNYNTAESDEGATWVPDSMILGDEIAAKDTVSFVLNPIAKTVTANLVGKYVKPADQLSCAEIYALADSAAVLMNGVVVTYVNGSNIFVKDETGAMLIYLPKNTSVAWKPGDILSNVRGIKVTYKGLVEVSPTQAQVAAVEAIEGYVPAPEELTFVDETKDMNKYIIVKGIEFDADTAFVEGKNGTIKINLGNQAIDLFNKFKSGYEFKAGKKYDIVAIVSYYNALQLYFVSAEAQVTTAYYLAGSMNGWTANEAYMFTANPANEGEYMLTTALAVNDEFKVIGVEGTTTTWYPDGMGNNYKVDDAHAGEAKTIYFRPEGGQEGWYAGYFFVEENELVKPTTAPAAPTAAEDDVLAIYCDQYKTNNLHFGISGWAGAYEVLDIDSTKIGYWTAMTWECIIDPLNTDAAHDLSGYKKLHVDLWAPKSAQIQLTVEAVAGGNYKDGQLVDLVQGWNSVDFVVADWKDGYDFKNVKCFVFEKYNIEGKPFAFANIYFYDKEAQGIENTNDNIKAIKRIENGMIIIEKNGKKYTITGQLVK